MPANAKRKAARRLKFGLGPAEVEASKETEAQVPSSPPSTREEAEDDDEDDDGGVALQPDEDRSANPPADAPPPDAAAADSKDSKEMKSRYILFVGNLPFDTTTEGIQRHFAAVQPTQVRHATDKATGKSRGFAFVEFDSHKRMDACLTRYHRSEYVEGQESHESQEGHEEMDGEAGTDEVSTEGMRRREGRKGARRINVQLTAGGGGKSETRRKRLQEKNEKLDRERHKRLKKAKSKKEERKAKKAADGATADGPATHAFENEEGMHPSRKARFARR